MIGNKIVIISDHPEFRTSLEALARQAGLRAHTVASVNTWLQRAGPESQCCVVLDTSPGDLSGPACIARLAAACASNPLLVLTQAGDVPTAVQAVRQGAAEVMQKPVDQRKILERIKQIIARTP